MTTAPARKPADEPDVTTGGDGTVAGRREAAELARRLAAIVESSSDAIVGKTLSGVITSWNASAEALYGYSAREAIGWPSEMLIPPARAGEEQAMVARLQAGERIQEYETERQRKDGTLVPVSLTASLVTGASGEALGVATISRDISERRAAEEALEESEARLQAVFLAAHDAILLFDPAADRILDANPRACQLLEYDDLDELLKTPPSEVHGQELRRFGLFIEECLRHGFGRNSELSCRTRTGRIVPAEVSASTLELAEGAALLTVIRDLTEQREAEADQGRLAAIVKGSVDAIVGLDLQGVITTWNPAAERLLGYAAADVIGRHVNDLVPEEGKAQQRAAHLRALQGELVRDWECERVRRDGTPIPVSITLSVIRDAAGVPLGLAKFLRDVRDRKRYEHERDIAETLQRALLPEAAPDLPGLAVATRYFPGGAGLQVGGDWYDVFPMPGGRLGVAVGDVVGHGVAAAAVMGQLRVALRAYAVEFASPATVLSCLGRLAKSLDDSQMATALYGVVDPHSATIELASAGHPPPLIVSADGEVSFLELDSAPPLGVLVDLPPTQVVERLEPGSAVLFYTDGLVERRGASIEDGMATVAAAAAGPGDLDALCDRVSDAMRVEEASDDVALLALSLVPIPGWESAAVPRASPPSMTQTAAATGDVVVVTLQGEIDSTTVDDAKHTLVQAAVSGARGVVIDLSGVTFLDSSGFNLLFMVARRLQERKQPAAVVIPTRSPLRKILCGTALDRLVPLAGDVADAIVAVRGEDGRS